MFEVLLILFALPTGYAGETATEVIRRRRADLANRLGFMYEMGMDLGYGEDEGDMMLKYDLVFFVCFFFFATSSADILQILSF
jgi:hypothetical protein